MQSSKKGQDGFDEETLKKIQAHLDELNRKKQEQSRQMAGKTKYIKFVSDKERKLLSFTGEFDMREVPEKDFKTGQVIAGKYKTRYSFKCYDITAGDENPSSPNGQSEPSIWERGTNDATVILYYLSKNKNVLEVIRNGQPDSTSTTYQINPPLD